MQKMCSLWGLYMNDELVCNQIENYSILRKLQLVQIEILNYVDDFCQKNHIKYSLFGGTLLGAVRHDGFIPWDDDLDICMIRSEYDRFIKLWSESEHGNYLIQIKETELNFTQSFAKIRKDHTCFFQKDEIPGNYHMGIFIDIFPMDRIPVGVIERNMFYWTCVKYQLYTREFIPADTSLPIKLFASLLLKTTSRSKRMFKRKKLLKRITRYNKEEELPFVDISTMQTLKTDLPTTLFDSYKPIRFEDGIYYSFIQWDEYLKRTYGDYMTLPPKEEQTWTHHPIILDFEHNYEELKETTE